MAVEVPATSLPFDETTALSSSIDMARTVLRNAGHPLSIEELRLAIRQTYGLEPVESLDKMLYKRALWRRGFSKTADGRYNIVEQPTGTAVITSISMRAIV